MKHALTTPEAAAILGISPSTLRSWKARGKGPAYKQPAGPGSQPYYDRTVIELYKLRDGQQADDRRRKR